MFNKKKTEERPGLDEAIDLALAELKQHDPHTSAYVETVTQIERLYALKTPEKVNEMSKDGMLAVAGNLIGIGMILSWEQVHVISSKALGFVGKAKI